MIDRRNVKMIPLPDGWTDLEKHLIYWHGWEENPVLDMDSDALRRAHEASHVHEWYHSGHYHLHSFPE